MAEDAGKTNGESTEDTTLVTAAEPADVAALQARLAELEAENQALREGAPDAAPGVARHPGAGRNAAAIIIAIIAAFAIALAVPAVWLNRMITDTDVYVETVAPLAEDPAIQDAVATAASTALIDKIDARDRIESRLPEDLQFLAGPLGQAVDDLISKQANTVVKSDQFATLWEKLNRASHKALVAAVTGREGKALNIEAGTFTLDVGVLAEEIQTRLQDAGLGLIISKIPASALDKQFVLYQSPVLAQMTQVFDTATKLAYWIPLLGLMLAGASIAIAADRRKAVLWLGAALIVASILPLEALYLGEYYAVQQLGTSVGIPSSASEAALTIIFRDLVAASQTAVFLGVVLWLGALIAGPARWAMALRRGLSGGLAGVASHLELGRFGVWVRARKRGLRVAGLAGAFAILLMLPTPRTVGSIVGLVLGYVVWVLLVEFFGSEPVEGVTEPAPEDTAEMTVDGEEPAPQA